MESFFVYDMGFLILFSLFIVWFLYKRRKNLKREMGIMFLYKTKIGIKSIHYIGEKFSKVLHAIKYFVVAMGFVLMGMMVFLLGKTVYTYIKFPEITEVIKAPPIAPLIPYFPRIFGMESFFPPLYFTYFILVLAIVAIVHEFSHGIYMNLFKIKIKSTGFVFLGPILGAFVEQDQKQMEKKSNFQQMTVLAAGTFANVIFGLLFFGLLIGFFCLSFAPIGYVFDNYAYSIIPVNLISGIGDLSLNLTEIYIDNQTYFLDGELKKQLEKNMSHILVYDDAPAVKAGIGKVITEINGVKILNQDDLREFLINKNPGDEIEITTLVEGERHVMDLTLGEHPANNSLAYLGVVSLPRESQGFIGKFVSFFMGFKNPSTHYEPKWDGDFVIFIYDFLWWVAIINVLVALFNMLPLGILDGGRFFYLTILSLTKSKKFAGHSYKLVSYLMLLLFALMMAAWLFAL